MTPGDFETPRLPSPQLLAQQSDWLAPARSRLLRRVNAPRRSALDLVGVAIGHPAIGSPFVRHRRGKRLESTCVRRTRVRDPSVLRVQCDAACLPVQARSFDLVFCQFALLWVDAESAIREICRVLAHEASWWPSNPTMAV